MQGFIFGTSRSRRQKNYEGSLAEQESKQRRKTPKQQMNSGSPLPPSFEETAQISYELHIKF